MAQKPKHHISEYTLPQRIQYRRGRRGLTQAGLAKLAKVSQSTIAQIEKGKKDPSISAVKRIAQALDVHIAVLFAADDVHVFDMQRLKGKYKDANKLNDTLYAALGRVIQWAREIGFLG